MFEAKLMFMTLAEAEQIKANYSNWIGKALLHIDPPQVRMLQSIEIQEYQNGCDVNFNLDRSFMMVKGRGENREEIREMQQISYTYFKPNFILYQDNN